MKQLLVVRASITWHPWRNAGSASGLGGPRHSSQYLLLLLSVCIGRNKLNTRGVAIGGHQQDLCRLSLVYTSCVTVTLFIFTSQCYYNPCGIPQELCREDRVPNGDRYVEYSPLKTETVNGLCLDHIELITRARSV